MPTVASNIMATTQFLQAGEERYAYRRFGKGARLSAALPSAFHGNARQLGSGGHGSARGGSRGHPVRERGHWAVPRARCPRRSRAWHDMQWHSSDGLGLSRCDVLGFSLGGMVAQQLARERPSVIRRMILVGTAPRGGEDIMHLEKPSLAKHLGNPNLKGYEVLTKLFFAPSQSSQAAGHAFIERLVQRQEDREPLSGPAVAAAQIAAFREWEQGGRRAIRGPEGHLPANARRERHTMTK